jgi:hypothetical protein
MALKGPKPKPKPNGVLTAFQKRTLKPVRAGPNKRTPVSYNDPYFNDGGKQVVFIVQNIVEKARRNGIDIYKVVWKQLGAGFDNVEPTWEVLENLKHMQPRILENFLVKHDVEQEAAAKQAEISRVQRVAAGIVTCSRISRAWPGSTWLPPPRLLVWRGYSLARAATMTTRRSAPQRSISRHCSL